MLKTSTIGAALSGSAVAILLLAGCATPAGDAGSEAPEPAATVAAGPAGDPAAFAVRSDDIGADGTLSNSVLGTSSVSCAGDGESMHLEWTEPPAGTESLALLFENTTVPFVYWAHVDIEPTETVIEHDRYGAVSGRELTNDIGQRYPVSPCPEAGVTEYYRVTVWALDTDLGADVETYVDLREAVVGHELATATVEAHALGLS